MNLDVRNACRVQAFFFVRDLAVDRRAARPLAAAAHAQLPVQAAQVAVAVGDHGRMICSAGLGQNDEKRPPEPLFRVIARSGYPRAGRRRGPYGVRAILP